MKITLALPSRNRPEQLLSVLTSYDALSTGNNEVTYALVVDEDDARTLEILNEWKLPAGVHVYPGTRDRTITARVNEVLAKHPAETYCQVVDDCYPLSQHWDAILVAAKQLPAFSWLEMNDPKNATLLVVSEKWRAATGRVYADYFPFWFADTWVAEVYRLAFGEPISVIQQLAVGGKRGVTQGMREVEFWFRFFAYTRAERLEEARKICESFGVTFRVRHEVIKEFEVADAYQLTQVSRYERLLKANVGEPSQLYLSCKAKAEEMMAA